MTIDEEVKGLVDNYYSWLGDTTHLYAIDPNYVRIVTPFLDRHNDYYEIFVSKNGDRYELTDDSYVMSDLKISGCDIESGNVKTYLDTITRSHGVILDGDELKVTADAEDFPSRKLDLIQAMQEIGDIYYTSKASVVSMFYDDVSTWLSESKISCVPNVSIPGNTYSHRINFALPNKDINGPYRVIQLMDRPGKDKLADMLLMKMDIPDIELFILINDSAVGSKGLADIKKAGEMYGMNPILWSERDDLARILSQ